MANFGAHSYYRIVIDSADYATETYWNIVSVLPMLGSDILPDLLKYTTQNLRVVSVSGRSLLDTVDKGSIVFTAGGDASGWQETFFGNLGYNNGDIWNYTPVGIHGTIQLPSPQYLPQWYLLGGGATGFGGSSAPITGISFYYSDNGADWVLIKTFTDAGGLFQGAGDNILFTLGEVYDTKIVRGLQKLNRVNIHTKAILCLNDLDECYLVKAIDNKSIIPSSPESDNQAYLGNVEWRLSGGSINTDPVLSLGGAMSTQEIDSQEFKPVNTTPGITIVKGSHNTTGKGTLTILTDQYGRLWLDWNPSGGISGGTTRITHSGYYTLFAGSGTIDGYLCVIIDFNLLDTDNIYPIYVYNSFNEILPSVLAAESEVGSIVYRCIYFHNVHTLGALRNLFFYLKVKTYSSSNIEIGIDPGGIGAEAVVIPDGNTAPAGVVFSSPTSDNPLIVGDIVAKQRVGIWVKREIVDSTHEDVANDLSIITYGVKTI